MMFARLHVRDNEGDCHHYDADAYDCSDSEMFIKE